VIPQADALKHLQQQIALLRLLQQRAADDNIWW
jgi:hypothetical protein